MFLAGIAAERLSERKRLDTVVEEAHSDVTQARQMVVWALPSESASGVDAIMRGEIIITTGDFLKSWWESLSAVATAALQEGSLSAKRITAVVAPAIEQWRRLLSYHEAAHTVVLWLEGNDQLPQSVEIAKLPSEGGENAAIVRPFSGEFYIQRVATTERDRELAQWELERVVAGEEMAKLIDPSYPGEVRAVGDRKEAQRLARTLAGDGGHGLVEKVEAVARETVRRRLQEPKARALVDVLASALLARGRLGEKEIRELLVSQSTEAPD
jgi:hypothetical protein